MDNGAEFMDVFLTADAADYTDFVISFSFLVTQKAQIFADPSPFAFGLWLYCHAEFYMSHRKHRYSRKFCLLLADVSLLSGADSLLAGRNPSVHGCSVSRQSFKQKSAGEHVRPPAILISFSRIYKSD